MKFSGLTGGGGRSLCSPSPVTLGGGPAPPNESQEFPFIIIQQCNEKIYNIFQLEHVRSLKYEKSVWAILKCITVKQRVRTFNEKINITLAFFVFALERDSVYQNLGYGSLVVKVSASRPKDRLFEPHQGQDHVPP